MSTTRRRTLLGRGRHDGGASAVEYALILAGVAILSIGAIFALGRTAKTAFTNATAVVSTQPAGVLPVVSESGGAGPGTTSAAPTTTSAAPTTTSAAPTTTTAQPSVSPTTTNSPGTDTAARGKTTTLIDLNLKNPDDLRSETADMKPSGAGKVAWDNDRLRIEVDSGTPVGTVITVTYSYVLDGVSYTGTITVTVTK
jgi:Flp pilus assembly pilin Flp